MLSVRVHVCRHAVSIDIRNETHTTNEKTGLCATQVPVERTVYKELSHELYIERERYEELVEENRRLRRQLEQMPREAPERVVYK